MTLPLSEWRNPLNPSVFAHTDARTDTIGWALRSGFLPLIVVNPGEDLNDNFDPAAHILWAPDHPESDTFIPILTDLIRAAADGEWYALGLDDYTCHTAAAVSAGSAMPCFSADSTMRVTRKHLLREQWNLLCLKRTDLPLRPIPSLFILFSSFLADDFQTRPSAWPHEMESAGPFIVKPDCLDASLGVRRAETYGEALEIGRSTVRDLAEYVPASKVLGFELQPAVLIDEEVPRSPALRPHAEYTAHILSRNDRHELIGISTKLIHAPSFTKIGQIFPA